MSRPALLQSCAVASQENRLPDEIKEGIPSWSFPLCSYRKQDYCFDQWGGFNDVIAADGTRPQLRGR